MKHLLEVAPMSQLFPLPLIMGCEGVAAAMLLQYNEHDISAVKIMKHWPKHDNNPEQGYVGHPSWIKHGVHQTIFPKAFVPYLKTVDPYIIDSTGSSLTQLEHVIRSGQPVILYHTHLAAQPYHRTFETSNGLRRWVSNIHIILLIGYDDYHYYYIDPLWQHIGKMIFPALIPCKKQIFKIKKDKLEQSYAAPGRLSIYKNM